MGHVLSGHWRSWSSKSSYSLWPLADFFYISWGSHLFQHPFVQEGNYLAVFQPFLLSISTFVAAFPYIPWPGIYLVKFKFSSPTFIITCSRNFSVLFFILRTYFLLLPFSLRLLYLLTRSINGILTRTTVKIRRMWKIGHIEWTSQERKEDIRIWGLGLCIWELAPPVLCYKNSKTN